MNKWLMGFLASMACLCMLSAVLVALMSIMYAVSYSPVHLWKLPFALPLAFSGVWILRRIDNSGEE